MAPPEAEVVQPEVRLFTKTRIQELVQKGDVLIIYRGNVYRLNHWLSKHPGGDLVIRHLNGRDATDQMICFHPESVTNKLINYFYVGKYVDELRPATDIEWEIPKKNEQKEEEMRDLISAKYLELEEEVKRRGLYDCNYWNYARESVRYILFLTTSILLILYGRSTWHYLLSAVCMGMFWQQLAFTAHDAGHNGITHIRTIDHLIGIFIAAFCGGLSEGWWKKNHYVHHVVTNSPEDDPDIQHLPFFAITAKFAENLQSSYYGITLHFDAFARFFIKRQHYLYYIILSFGRFNLYALSIGFLLKEPRVRFRWVELMGILFFIIWLSTLLSYLPSWPQRLLWIYISHVTTVLLHVQITLSHFGMPAVGAGEREAFASHMLRTSMDVDCPEWLDWFHGGLQFQTVHHLLPRVPRHNLRACQPFVRKFCNELGLTYHIHSFTKGNGIVLGVLKEVADQIQLMEECAKHNAKQGLKAH
ncbi:uncharacterized protein VTP21DRAFT_2337 [Calcarisporiella thermophila]|uniref:uncharacterized protein n=1 Tax=Calcarisporiella thermophila TaxID=911321 RepID=UPI0037424364